MTAAVLGCAGRPRGRRRPNTRRRRYQVTDHSEHLRVRARRSQGTMRWRAARPNHILGPRLNRSSPRPHRRGCRGRRGRCADRGAGPAGMGGRLVVRARPRPRSVHPGQQLHDHGRHPGPHVRHRRRPGEHGPRPGHRPRRRGRHLLPARRRGDRHSGLRPPACPRSATGLRGGHRRRRGRGRRGRSAPERTP